MSELVQINVCFFRTFGQALKSVTTWPNGMLTHEEYMVNSGGWNKYTPFACSVQCCKHTFPTTDLHPCTHPQGSAPAARQNSLRKIWQDLLSFIFCLHPWGAGGHMQEVTHVIVQRWMTLATASNGQAWQNHGPSTGWAL